VLNQIFGEYRIAEILILPRFAGTPARLLGGSSCFQGSFLQISNGDVPPVRGSRQRGWRSCYTANSPAFPGVSRASRSRRLNDWRRQHAGSPPVCQRPVHDAWTGRGLHPAPPLGGTERPQGELCGGQGFRVSPVGNATSEPHAASNCFGPSRIAPVRLARSSLAPARAAPRRSAPVR
jgi:hypothetical protein